MRAYYRTWYRDLVTALPEVENGYITVPPGPGLGLELAPDIDKRFSGEQARISKTLMSAGRRRRKWFSHQGRK